MNTQDIEIAAVIDRHLQELIRELKLDAIIESGELLCSECGKPITLANLAAIELVEDDVRVYCDEFIYEEDDEA